MWTKEFDSLTPRAKVVIERAIERAKESLRNYCDTGDLLLAMLYEPNGLAANALSDSSVNFVALEKTIFAMKASPASLKDNGEEI